MGHKPSEGLHLRHDEADVYSCSPVGQTGTISNYGDKNALEILQSPCGTCNSPFTHPHGKHAWTVREGAFVFEKIEVHLADVVLQVKCCGEVGLTVLPGANQHRLLGSMDPLVPSQQIHFLEHLLARPACKRGCVEESKQVYTDVFLL